VAGREMIIDIRLVRDNKISSCGHVVTIVEYAERWSVATRDDTGCIGVMGAGSLVGYPKACRRC